MALMTAITPATLSVQSTTYSNTSTQLVAYIDWTAMRFAQNYDHELCTVGSLLPLPPLSQIARASAASMLILTFEAPAPNSSYSIQFYGPTYKCQVVPESSNPNYIPPHDMAPTYSGTILEDSAGLQFWVQVPNKSISCALWNASFDVQFRFTNQVQSTTVQDFEYSNLANFTWGPDITGGPNGCDKGNWNWNITLAYLTHAISMSSLIQGTMTADVQGNTCLTRGPSPQENCTGIDIMNTGLAACPEVIQAVSESGYLNLAYAESLHPWMCRNDSLERAIEDLSRNITLSLFTYSNIRFFSPLGIGIIGRQIH